MEIKHEKRLFSFGLVYLAGLRLPNVGPTLYPKGHGLHQASRETDADTQAPHSSCRNVPESADKWDPK